MSQYEPLTALQSAVGVNAPTDIIFETIDALEEPSPGPRAIVTLSAVIHAIYNADGERVATYREAANALKCSLALVQQKHAAAMRRARHHLVLPHPSPTITHT